MHGSTMVIKEYCYDLLYLSGLREYPDKGGRKQGVN
jgi:hypothetical protein